MVTFESQRFAPVTLLRNRWSAAVASLEMNFTVTDAMCSVWYFGSGSFWSSLIIWKQYLLNPGTYVALTSALIESAVALFAPTRRPMHNMLKNNILLNPALLIRYPLSRLRCIINFIDSFPDIQTFINHFTIPKIS